MKPFMIGLALLVTVGIGVARYIIGGFPRDHDRYGNVPAPGQRVLELPEGDVRVNFENDATGSGDTRSIQDRAQGLAVRVVPAAGGEAIEVNDVPGWLFSSIGNDRGHEPFGKVEIPSAGSYLIQVPMTTPTGSITPPRARPLRALVRGPRSRSGSGPGRRWTRFSWARSSPDSRSSSSSSCSRCQSG